MGKRCSLFALVLLALLLSGCSVSATPPVSSKVTPSLPGIKLKDDEAIKEAVGWNDNANRLSPQAGIQLKDSVLLMCASGGEDMEGYLLVEVYPTKSGPKMKELRSYDLAQTKAKSTFSTEITSYAGEKATVVSTYNKEGELTGLTSSVNDPDSPQLEKKGQEYHQPKYDSPERKEILDAIRPRLEADFEQKVKFKVDFIAVENNFAYVSATPVQANGKSFDYKKYPKVDEWIRSGDCDDIVGALLKYQNGEWKVLEYVFGANDVFFAGWWKDHDAPCRIFGSNLPVNAWLAL